MPCSIPSTLRVDVLQDVQDREKFEQNRGLENVKFPVFFPVSRKFLGDKFDPDCTLRHNLQSIRSSLVVTVQSVLVDVLAWRQSPCPIALTPLGPLWNGQPADQIVVKSRIIPVIQVRKERRPIKQMFLVIGPL